MLIYRRMALLGVAATWLGCTASPGPAPSGQPTAPGSSAASSSLDAASTSSAPLPTLSASQGVVSTPSALSSASELPHTGPLASFHDALRGLERGKRKEHVRIMWLGDSHAQADFWTGALRSALQKRFGNAGPGFVHVGFKAYRHDGVRFDIKGKWRMRPKRPSTVTPWGDGAFGLGGILHAGFAGRRRVLFELTDAALAARQLRWDICYKHGLETDSFRFKLGKAKSETIEAESKRDLGVIRHLQRRSRGAAQLKLVIRDGRPDFCGVVVETDSDKEPAGVVLDNLGINGARYGTALAWNEQAWAKEVARRPAQLFILEYGGNEASDYIIKPDRYKQQAIALIARLRRVLPQASCLVIGPSDRADAEAKIPPINEAVRAAAKQASCMFWDTYEIMGGKGSLRKWRDDDRAAADGVHLRPRGYAQIGALLTQDLMASYRR